MKYTAVGTKVVVALSPQQSISAGGIIIPDAAQAKSTTGTVLSVGSEVREDIKVADVVWLDEYAGAVVSEENGVTIVSAEETEIFAVFGRS